MNKSKYLKSGKLQKLMFAILIALCLLSIPNTNLKASSWRDTTRVTKITPIVLKAIVYELAQYDSLKIRYEQLYFQHLELAEKYNRLQHQYYTLGEDLAVANSEIKRKDRFITRTSFALLLMGVAWFASAK
jgi:uncharacterized membrane protein